MPDHAGTALRRRIQGRKSDALQDALRGLDEDVAAWADEFVFGKVWAREGLSIDERRLVALAALAVGGHTYQLRNYLHGALQEGVPAEKLHEALVMTVVYAGFPTGIEALTVWRDVRLAHQRAVDAGSRP